MRELNALEVEKVSGGSSFLGITGVNVGLRAAGVGGALLGSFQAGYWVGTQIYNALCR